MTDFGYLKEKANNIFFEEVFNKKHKHIGFAKKYLKLIKEDEVLKNLFYVYSNISSFKSTDKQKIYEFIKENAAIISKYSLHDINKANNKLHNLIQDFDITLPENEKINIINESIDKLIKIQNNPNKINDKLFLYDSLANYIFESSKAITQPIDFNIPIKSLSKLLVTKFNEKYENKLSESEKHIIKSFVDSDLDKLYSDLLLECLGLVDKSLLIEGLDDSTKEKLMSVKVKLSSELETSELNSENSINKITKLIELKETLN